MKCLQCSSDLNLKELVPLPRLGRAEVAVCAFCGCFVDPGEEGGVARVLAACAGCGAPVEEAAGSAPGRCETCAEDTASVPPAPAEIAAAGVRILREALRVFPPLPGNESPAYFEQVLRTLTDPGFGDSADYRLIAVSGLGFRTVSIPGGAILAGTELLAGLEDEAMLAFVLAREIAHQQSGLTYRRYRSQRASWALLSRLEWGLGVLTRGAISTGRGDAAIVREVAGLGHGPVHEQHADESALRTVSAAGYDPLAAVRYLVALEDRHLGARGVLAAFLDSHPARSRRRCLAETLVAIGAERAAPRRVNREGYRRAATALMKEREELVGAGASGASPLSPND
jgi:predicted Zn-dependent protease